MFAGQKSPLPDDLVPNYGLDDSFNVNLLDFFLPVLLSQFISLEKIIAQPI